MNDRDGLYLENELVAPADNIATTYQGNDLTKPASLQTSYSQTFDLPDSIAIRKLTRHAEQLDSGSRWPYVPISAQVIQAGEWLFDGIAEMVSFSGGWEVELYEEKRNLFDRLDRSIRTADLSRYDHPWTIEEINKRAEAINGICYPVIDYGLLRKGILPPDTIFPAILIKTLIEQLLFEEGYSLVGDLPDDEVYKRLIMPFSESEPTSHDEQWQADRYARITMQSDPDTVDRGTLGRGYWLDRIQPYNIDNIDGFYQGKLHCYNTSTYEYICPEAMNLKVEGTQFFKALCVTGGIEVILSIEKNGNKVASARFEEGGGYNLLFLRVDKLSISETIKCKADDHVKLILEARRLTSVGAFRFEIYNDPDNSFVSFTPQLTTSLGDQWIVSRNLPDLTGTQLMTAIAYLFEGTWLVNRRRREIRFSSLTDTINNIANAKDWTSLIDTSVEPKWIPRIPPYAQNNVLSWKEIDQTKAASVLKNGVTLNYGDGLISIDAPVLDNEVTLFEMPFAASTASEESIDGYGNPVLIKTRSISGTGTNISINNQNTTARLLLVPLSAPFPIQTTQLQDDGITSEPVTVNLQPCWFGMRPDIALANDTAFTLSFSPLPINRGEQCMIDRNFQGLLRVLRRMRMLSVSMLLKPKDIASLDFREPIRLQRVSVGSLVISDGFYYLNKIQDYIDGETCMVTLVAY